MATPNSYIFKLPDPVAAQVDAYFDQKLGALEYRSAPFETETLNTPNFQGNAAVNYTDRAPPP